MVKSEFNKTNLLISMFTTLSSIDRCLFDFETNPRCPGWVGDIIRSSTTINFTSEKQGHRVASVEALIPLKTKSFHDVNFDVAGATGGCPSQIKDHRIDID